MQGVGVWEALRAAQIHSADALGPHARAFRIIGSLE
jgi:hypothetical protein